MSRYLVWFSAGAASAVAAKLTLTDHSNEEIVIAYTDPGSEHPDNKRFLDECEEWFKHPIVRLKSERYEDTWDVWESTKFLVSPVGARCTVELKKKVRYGFELPTDIQVFGYTSEEGHRAERFREQNPGVNLVTPLIERGLTKDDCLGLISRTGIELPVMYKLGYRNNNCIGCVKGGMGYWNKIRVDFPETFERMAQLERTLDRSVIRSGGEPVFLDKLDPKRGNHQTELSIECSLLCQLAEEEFDE
jgi:3'-phosphoadenosine 5'-phosphosulfate sulfotransferase (PAPS reductase)/FAD synthetase